MDKNNLVEIPIKDWPKLNDLYINWKLESNSCSLIQNYINWIEKDPSLKNTVKLYSLNGDWSDGTFILQDHEHYIMTNTLADSQERLLAALHCLDSKASFTLLGVPVRIQTTLNTYLSDLGMNQESFEYPFSTAIWHHIDLKKALEFDVTPPEGITLSALRLEDVDIVNKHWTHHHSGSNEFVHRLVTFNQHIGAYDQDGRLVAWCLVLPIGALGLLQVVDSHKRRGLGSLVVKAMSKMNATNGIETMAPVIEDNAASRAMFQSLGFQAISKIFWFIKPAIE